MDWVVNLHGQIVALDTAPLIYYLEEHPTYIARIDPSFDALERGGIQVVTSAVTMVEVLVVPYRNADARLARHYRDLLLNTSGLSTIPLSTQIAEEAARLRASHNLRTPDAIQLATALSAGAAALVTNDTRLPNLPQLSMLVLDEL